MKVVLVEPNNGMWTAGRTIRPSSVDPIALGYLGAVAQQEGHKVRIIQERTETPSELVDKIIEEEPDVVGYSTLTYSFPFAKEIAARVKQKRNVVNVFGGYHVSVARAEEDVARDLTQPIDFVVLGEGEETFRYLLRFIKGGDNPEDVKGIAFRKNGHLTITEPRQRITDLDSLPWPLRPKEYMQDNVLAGVTVVPAMSDQKGVSMMDYSRGCPFSCSYCASPVALGHEVTFRSAKDFVDELEFLHNEFGTNNVYLTDLTFNLNKAKVYELCDELEKRQLGVSLYVMCRPDVDEQLFIRMKQANISRIAWGVEALTDKNLDALNRNHDLQKTLDSIKLADSVGIATRGYVMMGFEQEGFRNAEDFVDQFSRGVRRLAEHGVDDIRLGLITPFPGTQLYRDCKEQGLILTYDFSQYDSEHPVLAHSVLKPEQQVQIRDRIFNDFYTSPEYQKHIQDKLARHPEMKKAHDEFMQANGFN